MMAIRPIRIIITASTGNAQQALNGINTSASAANRAVSGLQRAFAGLGAAALGAGIIAASDSYTKLINQMRVANVVGNEQRVVLDSLYQTANRYGIEVGTLGTLYSRLAQSQQALGLSQQQLLTLTQSVSAAIQINGTTVQEASGALLQLSQGLQGGTVRAEEFNSVNEAMFPLLKAAAEQIDRFGGSVAKMRAEVNAGKLSSQELANAIIAANASLTETAGTASKTIGASYQAIINNLQRYVGETNEATGASSLLTGAMATLAENISTIADAAIILTTVIGVRYVAGLVAATAAQIGLTTTALAMSVALNGVAATGRLAGASMLAMVGGPITIGLAAIGAGLYYVVSGMNDLKAASNSAEGALNQANTALETARDRAERAGVSVDIMGQQTEAAVSPFGRMIGMAIRAAQSLDAYAASAQGAAIASARLRMVQAGENASRFEVQLRQRNAFGARNGVADFVNEDILGLPSRDRLRADIRNSRATEEAARQEIALLSRTPASAFNTTPTPTPTPTPTGGSGRARSGGGAPTGESLADQLKTAQDNLNGFFTDLTNRVQSSRLFGVEQQIFDATKQLEDLIQVERTAGREAVSAADQARIRSLITEQNTVSNIARIQQTMAEEQRAALIANLAPQQRAEAQAVVIDRLTQHRLELTQGLTREEDILAAINSDINRELENEIIRRTQINDLAERTRDITRRQLADLRQIAGQASPLADRQNRFDDIARQREAITNNQGEFERRYGVAAYQQALAQLDNQAVEVANTFRTEMLDNVAAIGDAFGGKIGGAITKIATALQGILQAQSGNLSGLGPLGSLLAVLGSDGQGGQNRFGRGVSAGAGQFWGAPQLRATNELETRTWELGTDSDGNRGLIEVIRDQTDEIVVQGKVFKAFSGNFSTLLGRLMAGAQLGGAVGSIFGNSKTVQIGSQVGGAIGGELGGQLLGGALKSISASLGQFAGPLGSIVGGLVGGLIGKAFAKAKTGSQSFKMEGGKLVLGNLTGNNAQMKNAAKGAGGEVISGIYAIAKRLGADLNTAFTGTLASIGLRDGKYRVDPSGTGQTKVKKGAIDFGKDNAEGAIRYVIEDALRKGILTGLSTFSQAVLKSAKDMESALSTVEAWENILDEIDAAADPVGAATRKALEPLDSLRKQMVELGASSADLAKLESYRGTVQQKVIDDALKDITSLQERLNSADAGVSTKTLLDRELAKIADFESTLAAGGKIDNEKYADSANKVLDYINDLYGQNDAAFVDQIERLKSVTGSAREAVISQAEAATIVAINQQTTAVTDSIGLVVDGINVMNEYLRLNLEANLNRDGGFASVIQTASGIGSLNGIALHGREV